MANGVYDDPRDRPATTRVGTGGNRARMADRRYANQIRDINSNRRLTISQRRAANALAALERNAPRSATAVARPITTPSMRLLQDAVNNPRLTAAGRRGLIAGAAELGGRSDIAEDLILGGRGGLRSVRVRESNTPVGVSSSAVSDLSSDPVQRAGLRLRRLQDRGRRLGSRVSGQNAFNPFGEGAESPYQDSFDDLIPLGGEN